MAKKEGIQYTVDIDDNGDLRELGREAKRTSKNLDDLGNSARTVDRNMQGASKRSSNTTKNFSKMSQGMGGLVGAYATVAANVFALSAVFETLKAAADFENMKKGQLQFAAATGTALQAMTSRIQEASGGMLEFKKAAEAAAIGTAKGFTTLQLEELAVQASKASTALGRSYEDTYDRLIRGISKAEPELLDELGVTLKLETAKKRYAAANDLVAETLTSAQQSQAVLLETQRQLEKQFGKVEQQVNPFVQLQNTFISIARDVVQTVLPAFEAFANFLNKNAAAAATVLGAAVLLILNSFTQIIPRTLAAIKGLSIGAGKLGVSTAGVFGDISKAARKSSVLTLKALKKQEKGMKSLGDEAKSTQKILAKQAQDAGAKSKIFDKLAAGEELGGRDKAVLARALKSAEAQYLRFGKVKTGIFKGANKEILSGWKKTTRDIDKSALSMGQSIQRTVSKFIIKSIKGAQAAGRGLNAVLKGVGQTARIAGKFVNAAFKLTGVAAIIGSLILAFDELARYPETFVNSVINMVLSIGRGIEMGLNFIIKGINALVKKLPEAMQKMIGLDGGKDLINDVTIVDTESRAKLLNLAEGITGMTAEQRTETETVNKLMDAQASKLTDLKDQYVDLGGEIGRIVTAFKDISDPGQKAEHIANALASMGLSQQLEAALTFDPEDPNFAANRDNAIKAMLTSLGDKGANLGEMLPEVIKLIESKNVQELQTLEKAGGDYKGNLQGVRSGIKDLATQLKSSDLQSSRKFVQTLLDSATAADNAAIPFADAAVAKKALDEAFGPGGAEGIRDNIQALELEEQAIKRQSQRLKEMDQSLVGFPSGQTNERKLQLKVLQEELAVRGKLAAIRQEELVSRVAELTGNSAELENSQKRLELLKGEMKLLSDKKDEASENAKVSTRILRSIGQTAEDSLTNAFDGLIQGTMSAKQAFASMAQAILQMLAKMIAQQLAFNALTALGSSVPGLSFLTPPAPGARTGGIINNGKKSSSYSVGGVASGPSSGYPAILHGREAVVPLPHGNAIPVDLKGAGGQMNNIVINVSSDGRTSKDSASSSSDRDSEFLGKAIARAVQEELQNQKRSGGILSPYGPA